jgi:uncharacterized protein
MKRLFAMLATCTALIALPLPSMGDERPSTDSIHQLLEASGSRAALHATMSQIDANMQRGMEEALKGKAVSPAQQSILDDMRTKMVALLQEELSFDKIEPIIVDVYQKAFTQKEVNGMLTFYRSEVGKSMVAKMPQILTASNEAMRSKLTTLVPKLQELQRNTLHKLDASAVLQDPSAPAAPSPPPNQP